MADVRTKDLCMKRHDLTDVVAVQAVHCIHGQSIRQQRLCTMQLRDAADFREVKLKGKNHILKTGHYRLKNELKSDHKKVEQLQEQV